MKHTVILLSLLLTFAIMNVFGQTPGISRKLTYQGVLTYTDLHGKHKPMKKGTYSVNFQVFNVATGGTAGAEWTYNITVGAKGIYTVTLGENGTDQGDFTVFDNPFDNNVTWMQINVLSGPEKSITYPYTLSPRIQFTSVPSAWQAENAEFANDANVSNSMSMSSFDANANTIYSRPTRQKEFNYTAPVITGGHLDIPHGLTHDQIRSISVMVQAGTYWMQPNWTKSSGYEFYWYENIGNIHIDFTPTNDIHLLGQPVRVLITYTN